MKKIFKLLTVMMISLFIVACGEKKEETKTSNEIQKIKVTTTLNYYQNLIEEIGGDKVEVTGLMKEGEDPHLYVATAGDVEKLQNADLVVYGGLHLEGKMTDIFANLSNKYILNLGDQLDKSLLHKEDENTYDRKDYFENNLQAYLKSLDEATEYIQAKINEIPEESRYLITAHDAFAYFAEQFGLQVKAIQGVSTDSEIGTKQIEDLANFIVEHNIKAIFVESSVNHKSIEALQEAVKAKGGNVEIGGELYSDSMGDKENNTETYIKTIKANADTISNALK